MKSVSFWVAGEAVPQPRQRVSAAGGRARCYLPAKHPIRGWKNKLSLEAMRVTDRAFAGAVDVEISVVLKRRSTAPRRLCGELWHCRRPDIDNYAKAILDALNGIVWHDDGQVASLRVMKLEAALGQEPYCHVRVTPLPISCDRSGSVGSIPGI